MNSQDPAQVRFTDGYRSIAELLDKYRPFLRLLAARQLDNHLAARLSASDIVQQTQLEAFRDCGLFQGESEQQFVAWLKKILSNNVMAAAHTHIVAKKRSVKREQSFPDPEHRGEEFGGKQDSPSAKVIQGESAVLLAHAMSKLTDDQFEAIRLRYLEGLPISAIAERIGRSETAIAGLLKRGLRGLRNKLCFESDRQ